MFNPPVEMMGGSPSPYRVCHSFCFATFGPLSCQTRSLVSFVYCFCIYTFSHSYSHQRCKSHCAQIPSIKHPHPHTHTSKVIIMSRSIIHTFYLNTTVPVLATSSFRRANVYLPIQHHTIRSMAFQF